MSGEIKRNKLDTVRNYFKRLQSIMTGSAQSDSGTRNQGASLIAGTRSPANQAQERLWKSFASTGLGGFRNGKWEEPTQLANGQIPGISATPDQLVKEFDRAANNAAIVSMSALGINTGASLPDLMQQLLYNRNATRDVESEHIVPGLTDQLENTNKIPGGSGSDAKIAGASPTMGAGFTSLGTLEPQQSTTISPELQGAMDSALSWAEKVMLGFLGVPDSSKTPGTANWVVVEDMYKGTVNKTQDMQELFGTEGRFESAFDLSPANQGSAGEQDEASQFEIPEGKMLTLEEQKTLAAYSLYSAPKFYIPPMLVSNNDDINGGGSGTNGLKCFIFLSIGNLVVTDTTYPRNVPILKVPDADIDAVQDLGFGSGTIKVAGILWGEAGYARLQTLRELCKTRRALIWTAQETGAWLVYPQNVPGVNTDAQRPGQYFFELTMICVGKINSSDSKVDKINQQRIAMVKRKMKQELAILTNAESGFKLFSSKMNSSSGILLGYVWDPNTGNYKQAGGNSSGNPGDAKDLSGGELAPSNTDLRSRTSGAGGLTDYSDIYGFPLRGPPNSPKNPMQPKNNTNKEVMKPSSNSALPNSTRFVGKSSGLTPAEISGNIEHIMKEYNLTRDSATLLYNNHYDPSTGLVRTIVYANEETHQGTFSASVRQSDTEGFRALTTIARNNNSTVNNIIRSNMPIFVRLLQTTGATASEAVASETTYTNLFGSGRNIHEASPSELYYWCSIGEWVLSNVDFAGLEGAAENTRLLVIAIFGELSKRNLPARDASKTPSLLFVDSAVSSGYTASRLEESRRDSYRLATRQGLTPSFTETKGRFPVAISNNVPPRATVANHPYAIPTYRTKTNTNKWVPQKTKILKKPEE